MVEKTNDDIWDKLEEIRLLLVRLVHSSGGEFKEIPPS